MIVFRSFALPVAPASLLLAVLLLACGGSERDGDSSATVPTDPGGSAIGPSGTGEEPSTAEGPARLGITFLPGGDVLQFIAVVSARDATGSPFALEPEDLDVEVEGATVEALQRTGDGWVRVELVADRVDTGVPITVRAGTEATITREALPMHRRDAFWGLPEFVPGLVNTPGWEDSSEISPDGEWLIVSSYAPVDAFSCSLAESAVDHPTCNDVLGPWQAPERPDLFGADRIDEDGRIRHQVPALCFVGEDGGDFPIALPPTAAYGFRLQEDGSFAEPFVIGYAMDGYPVAPFGFSFVGGIEGREARVVYGHADIREFDEKGLTPNLYVAPITLGERNVLGRFTCDTTSGLQFTEAVDERLEILPHTIHKGNPYLEASETRVWFDDESGAGSLVYFAVREDGTWTERIAASAPVNQPGQQSYQPYLHGDRLFWARNFNSIQSARLDGEDPAADGTWDALRTDLALAPAQGPPTEATPGTIVAMGEPSVAVDAAGVTWLYFVAIRRTATGFNADIARVRSLSAPSD